MSGKQRSHPLNGCVLWTEQHLSHLSAVGGGLFIGTALGVIIPECASPSSVLYCVELNTYLNDDTEESKH